MDAKTKRLYEAARIARDKYQIGAINRDEVVVIVLRYINHANRKGKELAKHYGVTFKPISICGFLR